MSKFESVLTFLFLRIFGETLDWINMEDKMLNQQENKKACLHKQLLSCSLSGTAMRSGHVFSR